MALVPTVIPTATAAAQEAETVMATQAQNSWGVTNVDRGSSSFHYYSLIFGLANIGDRVYAGGKFLEVTNGSSKASQPYMAAFDQESGDWIRSFRPDVDGPVYDLEADPERNRLFVGGEFPSANGDSKAAGLVALDATTGKTAADFGVTVGTWGGAQPRVHALDVADGYLYIAGYFWWIRGNDGKRVSVSRLARVDLATGNVDADWTPRVSGGSVWEVKADPAHDRVLLGGPFRVVNATSTAAFAIVNDTDGELADYDRGFGLEHFDRPGNNYDFAAAIAVADDRLVIGGQEHRTIITDSNLNFISAYETHGFGAANGQAGGDTQTIAINGDIAYVGCHCWGRIKSITESNAPVGEGTDVRSMFAVDLRTGELVNNYQPDFGGQSGPWASLVDDDGCLWLGSDIHQAGQRRAYGLIKTCPRTNLAAAEGVTATLHPGSLDATTVGMMAIDGDMRTNHQVTNIARSTRTYSPALYIDLGSVKSIDDVILWGRTDGLGTPLQKLSIYVSNEPMNGRPKAELRADPEVTRITRYSTHAMKRTLAFSFDREARYIRIEVNLWGHGRLEVAEVAVTGGEAQAPAAIPLRSTRQTRERIVLNWQASGPVTIRRDGEVIGTDSDGWFTDLKRAAGTSYTYTVTDATGATGTLTVATKP